MSVPLPNLPFPIFSIAITPSGTLKVLTEASVRHLSKIDSVHRNLLAELDASDDGKLILMLAEYVPDTAFVCCPSVLFWKNLARAFIFHLLIVERAGDADDLSSLVTTFDGRGFIQKAPFMRGSEYFTVEVLHRVLLRAITHLKQQASLDEALALRFPKFKDVGRVYFHLAEHKVNPDRPFAFVATYSTGLNSDGKLKHQPIGKAFGDGATQTERQKLLAMLLPIKKAAEKSKFLMDMFETGAIFESVAWSAPKTFEFLQEVPVFESEGIVVRMRGFRAAGGPVAPRLKVTLGDKPATGVGLDSLVDFSLEVALGDNTLTKNDLEFLLAQGNGLVKLKGDWVLLQSEMLQRTLDKWRNIEARSRMEGISFKEASRLLTGLDAHKDSNGNHVDAHPTSIQAGKWLESTLASLRTPPNDLIKINGLKASLRDYQSAGLRWLWEISSLGLGGCLADDMGLGKTVQVISLLMARREQGRRNAPVLLVVPASLIGNWIQELGKFAPSLTYITAHPSELAQQYIKDLDAKSVSHLDLVITTYSYISKLPFLSSINWDIIILDEAQAIKNGGARQSKEVKKLKSSARLALTGTPVENSPADLWSLFDFLNPGLLGSKSDFSKAVKGWEGAAPLRSLVRPYILRRLKTDPTVVSDLPDKTELKVYCSLTKKQAVLYKELVIELKMTLQTTDGIGRKGAVLSTLMQLKQLCNHPTQWSGEGNYCEELSGKFTRLREICEEIAARQEKVLIFTQFREITRPIAEFLEGIFLRPGLVLDGSTAVKDRKHLVADFEREKGPPFFVLSVKAGGTGLNLVSASHVIHFDRWWNPAVENQATDRAFRIGQKKNVVVHKFICKGTLEERIDSMIEEKKELSDRILSEGGERALTELSNDELMSFIALDVSKVGERL